MKRIVSVLLAVCTCLSVGAMLASCGDEAHTHTYKTEWSKDATHHWHDCEGEACIEVSDKAEHVWDEGKITSEATAGESGEKTYTCTVCHATKGEAFAFTGISEEKWKAMISPATLTNYTLKCGGRVTQTDSGTVTVSDQSFTVKFNADNCCVYGTVKPEGEEELVLNDLFTGEDFPPVKETYESLFLALLAEYKNYRYNSADNVYELPEPIDITIEYEYATAFVSVSNSRVSISDDGKLLKLVCNYSQREEGLDFLVTSEMTYTFSDYNTTVISESAE